MHTNRSARRATFSFDPGDGGNGQREAGNFDGAASADGLPQSFPQPADVAAEDDTGENGERAEGGPSAERDTPPPASVPGGFREDAEGEGEAETAPEAEPDDPDDSASAGRTRQQHSSSKSFATARSWFRKSDSDHAAQSGSTEMASGEQSSRGPQDGPSAKALGKRKVSRPESLRGELSSPPPPSNSDAVSVEARSSTSLLHSANRRGAQLDTLEPTTTSQPDASSRAQRSRDAFRASTNETLSRVKSQLRDVVRFDIPEDSVRASIAGRMSIARAATWMRRRKLQDGAVVMTDRMLVRVDTSQKSLPAELDENTARPIEFQTKQKWREYIVVCRQSSRNDSAFVLQMYKTRVSQRHREVAAVCLPFRSSKK